MTTTTLLRPARLYSWTCQSCIQKRSIVTHLTARAKNRKLERAGFQWKYGAKLKQRDQEWAERATRIRAGEEQSLFQILKDRGFIHQVTGDEKELERIIIDKRIGIYAGIDPTGPSMHVGHLLPFMVLLWFYLHGHHAVSLLGGSTSRIGDPTGRTEAREQENNGTRKANMASMHLQLVKLWENMERAAYRHHGYTADPAMRRSLVNNNRWWAKLSTMEFMNYVGRYAKVGPLLSRETAKRKLEGESGLSFAELGYPLMQGYDWFELFKQMEVQVQVGGADQFGNIVTGIDIVNDMVPKVINSKVELEKFHQDAKRFGFTVPLLTTSNGEKIGKSAGNAIYLDYSLTSPFDLYRYFLSLSDVDAARFLKLFTLIPLPEIATLVEEHQQDPSKRLAHHRLAFEVLQLVHGTPVAQTTAAEHKAMFGGKIKLPPQPPKNQLHAKNPNDLSVKLNPNVPQVNSESLWSYHGSLPRSLVFNQPPARVLYAAGLVSSKSEGQRLINAKGAYYGGETGMEDRSVADQKQMPDELKFVVIKGADAGYTEKMIIGNDTLILRTGKTKVRIIRILSDREFDEKGLTAPGWEEFKAERDAAGATGAVAGAEEKVEQ